MAKARIIILPHATIRLGARRWYIRSRWLWALISPWRHYWS